MTDNPPQRGATRRFKIGAWEFEYYGFREHRRWGANAHGRGVDMSRTPIGAALALRRWLRAPSPAPALDDR